MENNDLKDVEQNTNSINQNTPQKSGKAKTIVLVVILSILMLAIGVLAGIVLSGKGDMIINKTQEIIKGEDENKSGDNNKTFSLSGDFIGYWSDKNQENSVKIDSINGNTIKFDFGIFRTASFDDITATLVSDNLATFVTEKEKDGMVLEGKLTFEDKLISLEITKSDSDLIKAGYKQNYAYKNLQAITENSNTNQASTNSNVITQEDYVKKWETELEDTEIQLYENGIFVTDHYTKASEIKGNYRVHNNAIELTTEDGKKWEGMFLIESGEITLNIKMDEGELKFYDMKNHTSMEKVEGVYTTAELTVVGKYENKSETDGNYHDAEINITDQGESIIKFEINAVNGTDIDHVNIGELKGIANKVGTNKYVYEEKIDGKDYKITFLFDAHRSFQWVDVKESYYPDESCPYAGHGVYFTGNYEMVY